MITLPKTTILYDLDGTLIDSAPDLSRSINHMLISMGKDRFDDDTIHHWVGNGSQVLVKRALVGKRDFDEDIDSELFDKAFKIFMDHYRDNLCNGTYLYPSVQNTLEKLKKYKYKQVIVTNKPAEFVQPIIDKLGIDEYIDYFIGGDSLSVKKPDPAPLLHICKKFELEISECIMIGDSRNDILAAKACGMDSIAVSYGYNYGEDISIYDPSVTVDKLSDIIPIVTGGESRVAN